MLKYDEFINESKKIVHSYGCLMLAFDFPDWKSHLDIINKDDIYDEKGFGLETDPHVTVLYGILPEVDIDNIKELCYINSDYCTIKECSIFANNNIYDVVKYDVESKYLLHLNEILRESLPYHSDFYGYTPHMTLSYVKAGRGVNYIHTLDKPLILKPSKLIYSYPDGNVKKIVDIIKF